MIVEDQIKHSSEPGEMAVCIAHVPGKLVYWETMQIPHGEILQTSQ